MQERDYLNLIAVLFSPVVAVGITLWYQRRKERLDAKRQILTTLIVNQWQMTNPDLVRALNTIDLVFHDSKSVRDLWHELFGMLNNAGLNNPVGASQRQKKLLELTAAMATDLGYGRAITHLDVDRVYYPVGLSEQVKKGQDIADELLRVLRATEGLAIAPKQSDRQIPDSQSQKD